MHCESRLRGLEDDERSRGAAEVKQAAAVVGDRLVVTGARAEKGAELVAPTPAPSRRRDRERRLEALRDAVPERHHPRPARDQPHLAPARTAPLELAKPPGQRRRCCRLTINALRPSSDGYPA